MDLSVIIPTHNRRALLERALTSVLAQTVPAKEVIVVDDGSSDDTGAAVRARFPGVRYLWQPNRGVSAARNRGIATARSEWLAFLDSDDEWLPRKLERQCAALAHAPDFTVCHTEEIWIRRGRRVNARRRHQKYGGHIFQRCLPLCVISPSSVLMHRRVTEAVGAFDERLPACEDYDLWLRVCARYPVLFVAEPLIVKHGGHADQLSRRHPAMDRFRITALERILRMGKLAPDDRLAALEVLRQKLRIYAGGAAKRGNWDEVARCRNQQAACEALAAATGAP